jgi:hypothetical protein
MFSKKQSKESPSCEKKIPKEIHLGLIQLFISKISPFHVGFNVTMETKVKHIDLASLEKMILKIRCNILFKVVELIICVSV